MLVRRAASATTHTLRQQATGIVVRCGNSRRPRSAHGGQNERLNSAQTKVLFDPVHGADRHIQGLRQLGSRPTVIALEENPRLAVTRAGLFPTRIRRWSCSGCSGASRSAYLSPTITATPDINTFYQAG